MLLTWTGFVVSLAAILVISRKNLAVGLISGGVVLGLIVLPFDVLWGRIVYTFTDPEIIMLALAMGVIPVLGGVMLDSGQVDSLVSNVRLRKRYLLPFSAALMGLLPMPGGALLSAPILQKGGEGVPDDLKAVINNWFRHLFLLVYPLNSALIVLSQIAGLDMYRAILYVLPGFAVALALGYLFFLRRVHGSHHHTEDFSWGGLLLPFSIILVAPMLDFTLKRTLSLGAAATLIAVSMSLILAVSVSRNRLELKAIVRRMKPWNFALIIVGMFLYLHIFEVSEARAAIAAIPLPLLTLSVGAGFLLGFLTGRIQLPGSIVLPVYMATAGGISFPVFALIYFGIYYGYVTSPVHPCLVVTCEYFGVTIRRMLLLLLWPTIIIFVLIIILSYVMQ